LRNIEREKQIAEKKKKNFLMKKKENEEKLEKSNLLKIGYIEDKDLLENFVVKADPIPLRKLKNNVNSISDKFDNFFKKEYCR